MTSLLEQESHFSCEAEPTLLVLACGAVAREVLAVIELNRWTHVELQCLPAALHNTPRAIASAVDRKLAEVGDRFDSVFVAYADCGTAGELDRVLARHGVERLPGAHCYAFYAGIDAWSAMHVAEPGTYYLTDFLARHFEALVVKPLGLDRYPELRDDIFGNYRRLVHLAQTDDPALDATAREAADLLGLSYERHVTGLGELQPVLERFASPSSDA